MKDIVFGTIYLKGLCDLKCLVDTVDIDVKEGGMDIRWKNMQEKEYNVTLQIFGVPSFCCHEGAHSHFFSFDGNGGG